MTVPLSESTTVYVRRSLTELPAVRRWSAPLPGRQEQAVLTSFHSRYCFSISGNRRNGRWHTHSRSLKLHRENQVRDLHRRRYGHCGDHHSPPHRTNRCSTEFFRWHAPDIPHLRHGRQQTPSHPIQQEPGRSRSDPPRLRQKFSREF